MKIFLDTNVLIAVSVRQHPHHGRAEAIFSRCVRGLEKGFIHGHSLLEFHSAITQLPKGLAVPSHYVNTILGEGILPFVECVTLTIEEIIEVQKIAGEKGILGGMIYDAFLLAAAQKAEVDHLYTFNVGHFTSIAPSSFSSKIVAP